MQKNSDNFSVQEAMRLAKTPAGQQLIAILKDQNPDAIKKAMNHAASGNYDTRKECEKHTRPQRVEANNIINQKK